MSHNMQQYPRTGTDLQSLPDAGSADPLAQVDTLKIVACPICRATYVPTSQQPASKTGLLETAFLAVCHFCFRCQRPACPQCWNPIHHTCASCSEEARLPFRTPVPSVEGLVFLPSASMRLKPEQSISFTCQRNGRFYTPKTDTPARITFQETAIQPAISANELGISGPHSPLQRASAASAPGPDEAGQYPGWLQEVLGEQEQQQEMSPLTRREQQTPQLNMYAPAGVANALPHTEQYNMQKVAPLAYQQAPAPEPPMAVALQKPVRVLALPAPIAEPQNEMAFQDDPGSDDVSLLERIENVLIIITSILLLAVVLMIVLSIVSAEVNTFFLHLLHIDIRTEIAYLLQLR